MGKSKVSKLNPMNAVKRQLVTTIYQTISRLETMEDTKALYAEVQRAYAYRLINDVDFCEMTRRLDEVIKELTTKENEL